ncbi:MAG: FtsX-like permease family protein [Patescibacteria group bacterium]|jgi:ABC-type antimicrobial peptide transport system permease subunit
MIWSTIVSLNFKKLRTYKGKALFLILPVAMLMVVGVTVTSQATNLLHAAEQRILGTAKEAARLIQLSPAVQQRTTSGAGGGQAQFIGGFGEEYTASDVDKVSAIPNVSAAELAVDVPAGQATTSDLQNGKTLTLGQLKSVGTEVAKLYTNQDFSYTAGQPIPIVLTTSSLIHQYTDWGGKTEVTLELGRPGQGRGPEQALASSPIKFEAVELTKDELMGKEFTVQFGTLETIQDYTQEFTDSGLKFTKLTDAELKTKEADRKSALSTYWNYDALAKPLTYTFKVVGVVEVEGRGASYVPTNFVNALMHDLIQKQLSARTKTALPTDKLNSTFTGMTYDGVELGGGQGGLMGGGIRVAFGQLRNGAQETTASYAVPGLVISTERETGDADAFARRFSGSGGTVKGVVTDADVFTKATVASDTMLVQIASAEKRAEVVKALNNAGYAYTDVNDLEVYTSLQNTLSRTVTCVLLGFILITALVIIFTMGKFVAESRKEIGVFRALGATKASIKQLFLSQAVLYTGLAYVAGALLGIGVTLGLAKAVQLWFDRFVGETVQQTFTVVQQSSANSFAAVDWARFGLLTGLLFVTTIIVAIIPAVRASNVSPVQAMKSE